MQKLLNQVWTFLLGKKTYALSTLLLIWQLPAVQNWLSGLNVGKTNMVLLAAIFMALRNALANQPGAVAPISKPGGK